MYNITKLTEVLVMEFMLILYRLTSRAVLVYFKEVCPRTSEEQDAYDIMLDEAMELAPAAAGEIIALGKTLVVKRDEFIRKVLSQVQSALPEAIHRVQRSYGLAIFAALEVCRLINTPFGTVTITSITPGNGTSV